MSRTSLTPAASIDRLGESAHIEKPIAGQTRWVCDDAVVRMVGGGCGNALDTDDGHRGGAADVDVRCGLTRKARRDRLQHHSEQAAAGRLEGAGVLAHRSLRLAGASARRRWIGEHRVRHRRRLVAHDDRARHHGSSRWPTCDTGWTSAAAPSCEIHHDGPIRRVHARHVLASTSSLRCRSALLEGEACFETPTRAAKLQKGETLALPGDTPMRAVVTGSARRHVLAVIVHDAVQPATMRMEEGTGPKLVACK